MMNVEEDFWKELKDDWSGRIYKAFDPFWQEFHIVEDRGEELVFRQNRTKGDLRIMKRQYIKNKLASGSMTRVK